MEKVRVTGIVEFANSSIHHDAQFTDSWNFKVGRFLFKKLNSKELEVTFEFDARLNFSEEGKDIREIPSEPIEEFQEVEQELETVLDLIAFQTNVSLKARSGSYTMSASGGSSIPVYNQLPVKDLAVKLLEDQYMRIASDKVKNKNLIAALRQNHISLSTNEPSEKVQKLYSILELISTKGAGGSLFTKQELDKLSRFTSEVLGKSKEVCELIRNQLGRLKEKSENMAMIENIKLIDDEGEISREEITAMLAKFRSARAIPAHGSMLPRRSEEVEDLLWDLETIAKDEIDNEISPRSLHYLVFREKDVQVDFFSRNKRILSTLERGLFAYSLRYEEVDYFSKNFTRWLLNPGGEVYLISYDRIKKLTEKGIEEIIADILTEPLKSIIATIQSKLSNL